MATHRARSRWNPPAVVVEGEPVSKATLSERMAALHVPGVSIAVIHNDRLDWARGFGVTQVGGSPITPETLFQAASISKPITALAVLQLVQSGRLDLDADVNEYLKSWKIPANVFTAQAKVTLRELLNHTAGITVEGFGGYSAGEPLPTLLQTLDGLPPANNGPIRVDTAPGTIWRYAGRGYVVLRQILTDVTGHPFEMLMHDMVLGPIGMEHSTFEQPLPLDRLAGATMPADREGRTLKHGAWIYPEMAPDGLWTTASDLARYAIEVQRSLAGKPNSLLSVPIARLMLTPRLNHWGLGPIVGDDELHPYFTHSGGNYGFPCLLIAYNRSDGAVIMTNGEQGYELAIGLIRSIAQEYKWPDFKPVKRRIVAIGPKTLDNFVGAYQSAPDSLFVVTREGHQLFIQATGHARQPMFPMSERRFFLKDASPRTFFPRDDEVEIAFNTDAAGKAAELDLLENGVRAAGSAKRMEDGAARRVMEEMAALEKRFKAQEPAVGGDSALRRLLGELAQGKPDYDRMTTQLANAVRSVVVLDQQIFSTLGPVVSMSFKRVAPTGVDTYHVVFQTGDAELDISLQEDGKIRYVRYLPE